MRFGASWMQGWRNHMEDAHIVSPQVDGLPTGYAFYVVLDGHAGSKVAEYSAEVLEEAMAREVIPVVGGPPSGLAEALRRVFLDHDLRMQRDFDVLRSRSGSTCTAVLVTPEHFIFCNLGDSRSLLCRQGRPVFATKDHKPTDPVERARVRGAGGFVVQGRVDGGLAVSRAFGDFEYKMRSDLPAVRQRVSAEPDTHVLARDPGQDTFLLLACDGIWDVMSNQVATKFVMSKLKKGAGDLEGVCQNLIKRCLQLGSRDNMSVVLVLFDGLPQPQPQSSAAAAAAQKRIPPSQQEQIQKQEFQQARAAAVSPLYADTHHGEEATLAGSDAGKDSVDVQESTAAAMPSERLAAAVAHTAVASALASLRYCLTGSSVLPREELSTPASRDETAPLEMRKLGLDPHQAAATLTATGQVTPTFQQKNSFKAREVTMVPEEEEEKGGEGGRRSGGGRWRRRRQGMRRRRLGQKRQRQQK